MIAVPIRAAFAALLLVPFPTPPATTIVPLTVEQLVHQASFVAVVECTVAGGIVARYKVLDSLKGGVEAGKELDIRTAVNYWEPQFPLALAGERSFVTAFKSPPNRMTSTTSGGGVPLWWRNLPCDVRLPLFQGKYPVPTNGKPFRQDFDRVQHADLESFIRGVKAFLAAPNGEQERIVLQSVARRQFRPSNRPGQDALKPVLEESLAAVHAAKDMAGVVEALLKSLDRLPPDQRYRAISTLREGGKPVLGILRALPPDGGPLSPAERKRLEEDLEPDPPSVPDPEAVEAPPSAADLREHRESLARGGRDAQTSFLLLAKHDPAPAAQHAAAWVNQGTGWSSQDAGYVVGSTFAVLCGKDRAVHLRTLSKAADPFIRVAGAVYLAMENETEGVEELKKLTSLKGDAGGWAALTLARRGHAAALPRALELLREPGPSQMAGVPHRNFQKRIQELISNSARASGVEPPAEPEPDPEETPESQALALHKAYGDWWEANRGKVRLADPWLPALNARKVD